MADDMTTIQTPETMDDFEATALGEPGDGAGTSGADDAPDPPDDTTDADPESGLVPESYALTAPEGLTLDPAAIEMATPVFRELGLTNDQANKLMPVAAEFAAGITDKLNQQIIGQVRADRKAWLDTARADPEIGGAHWNQTLSLGAAALDRLGFTKGSAFRTLLDESGLGNHPEMIRAWSKVGRAIGEDGNFARTQGVSTTRRDTAETLYPNDTPKEGQ